MNYKIHLINLDKIIGFEFYFQPPKIGAKKMFKSGIAYIAAREKKQFFRFSGK